MKDIVVVEIDAPQERVAALYADPENTMKWMDDVERTIKHVPTEASDDWRHSSGGTR